MTTSFYLEYNGMSYRVHQDLELVFPSRAEIKTGANHEKLFAQPQSPTAGIPEITDLRNSVAQWDENLAVPLPDKVDIADFIECNVAGIPSSVYINRTPSSATVPTILLVHGGGFFCEMPNVFKSLLAHVIAQTPCNIVMPHYALSPEFKAPVALNEVTKVLTALITEPHKYQLSDNIMLIGCSAGGSLAWNALITLLNDPTHEERAKKISNFIMVSPWTDISMETSIKSPYQAQQNKDIFLQASALELMKTFYLAPAQTGTEAEISPLYHPVDKLKKMPKTTIIVGEIDRLFADSVATAKLINKANVPVELVVLEGQSHNHFSHRDLRDGVFVADIIASIMKDISYMDLKGDDGLGIVICQPISHDDTPWKVTTS